MRLLVLLTTMDEFPSQKLDSEVFRYFKLKWLQKKDVRHIKFKSKGGELVIVITIEEKESEIVDHVPATVNGVPVEVKFRE